MTDETNPAAETMADTILADAFDTLMDALDYQAENSPADPSIGEPDAKGQVWLSGTFNLKDALRAALTNAIAAMPAPAEPMAMIPVYRLEELSTMSIGKSDHPRGETFLQLAVNLADHGRDFPDRYATERTIAEHVAEHREAIQDRYMRIPMPTPSDRPHHRGYATGEAFPPHPPYHVGERPREQRIHAPMSQSTDADGTDLTEEDKGLSDPGFFEDRRDK